jgi:S1-C subfamily serine protease
LVFKIAYTVKTDAVTEVRVTGVVVGSAAEKIGIRKGDRLTEINGIPVEGRRRSSMIGKDGRLAAVGKLTFEGKRGLFGKDWTVTVDSGALRPKKGLDKTAESATAAAGSPSSL